jgi:hypothetical protein
MGAHMDGLSGADRVAGRSMAKWVLATFPPAPSMNQPASRTLTKIYYLITFLLLLTPALLLWQHFGMSRIIEISPRQPHGARVTDDSDTDNGNSVSSLVYSDDAIVMHCTLGRAISYPFCKLQFCWALMAREWTFPSSTRSC